MCYHRLAMSLPCAKALEADSVLVLICRICNSKIISDVQQIICFAFHDSKVLLQTCRDAKENQTIVTLCYLD
jgi:hypothetical protein